MDAQDNMSFFEHLEALRWHLIRSFGVVVMVMVVAFIYHQFLFDSILFAPMQPSFFTNRALCYLGDYLHIPELCINQQPIKLINITMSGQFSTHMWVSFVTGLVIAFPYLFWELWRFIKPAMNPNQVKHASLAILVVSLLFACGVLFGYYVILPFSIEFLGHYQVSTLVDNPITLTSYISTVTSTVLAAGVTFELPIVIWFFAKIGLVSSRFLKRYRRHAILLIAVFAAVITPPDIVSMLMVGLPMLVLYEVGIVLALRIEKRKLQ